MAVNVDLVHFTTLTGGGGGALDAIDVSGLDAGAIAMGKHSDGWKTYQLQVSAGAVESVPGVILPDTPSGDKWWKYLPSQSDVVGRVVRPIFSRPANNQVTLTPAGRGAGYHIDGVGWCYFTSALTYTFTALAASTKVYLYIDYSTLTGSGLITAANLIDSVTAPGADGYNGNDRCIFGVLTDASSNILDFLHDGGRLITYKNNITDSTTVPGSSFTSYGPLSVPGFCRLACIEVYAGGATVGGNININTDGGTGSQHVMYVNGSGEYTSDKFIHAVSSGQLVYLGNSATGVGFFRLFTDGWWLPAGM